MAKSKNTKTSKNLAKATRKTKAVGTEIRRKAKPAIEDESIVKVSRRATSDRRADGERRKIHAPVEVERRKLQRREKVNRRRQIDPTTCERDYSPEEVEFMNELDQYKRTSGRMFPTCSEILEVLHELGYRKSIEPAEALPQSTSVIQAASTDNTLLGSGGGLEAQPAVADLCL